jgi:putative transposase
MPTICGASSPSEAPPRSSPPPRRVAIPHDAERYKLRNVIERTFCRIKDFRGIATRYDKTARNFLPAVCLVSAITYWA